MKIEISQTVETTLIFSDSDLEDFTRLLSHVKDSNTDEIDRSLASRLWNDIQEKLESIRYG
jgi:hypothetical protein